MKKFSLIKMVVLFAVAMFTFEMQAVSDLGTMEPGQTYSFPQYDVVMGQYTPSQTGPVKVVYTTNTLALYSSPNHSEGSLVEGSHSYFSGGQVISYSSLEGGKTYYFYSAMTMNAGEMTIYEGSQELKLVSITPAINPEAPDYYGGKFSVSSNYNITVEFNFQITAGNTFLIVGDHREPISATVYGTSIECSVAQPVMQFYHTGLLKEGDTMTLRILNVADAVDPNNKYGENGKFEADFVMAAKPIELVEIVNAFQSGPNVLDSFYFPDDERGKISFVFDGDLSTTKEPRASITYGNSDNIEVGIYTEDVVGDNEGNKAIFDFTGKVRRPIDMLPLSTDDTQPGELYVSFNNIFSADGQRAFTNSISSPTSYGMSFKINTLQYSLAADYTPARETPLQPGTPFEIWVLNGNKISFDGIVFTYIKGGKEQEITVPNSQITSEEDPYSEDSMIFTLQIPEYEADENSSVIVKFANLKVADGLDHSADLTAEFKAYSAGVDMNVSDADKIVDVYSATGVRVLKGVRINEISKLEKGLYFINGCKYLRR